MSPLPGVRQSWAIARQPMTVAAIQLETQFCDTDANLRTAGEWVRKAQKLGAKWIMLPECFTSGLAWDPRMRDAWEPFDGKPMQMLKELAQEGDTVVAGSFLAKSGRHIRNTLVLAMPNRRTFTHDKDIPSIGESCYFVGGEDDVFLDEMVKRGHEPEHREPIPTRDGNNKQGVFHIDGMTVGGVLCWELIRSRAVTRFAEGEVDMVIGGSVRWRQFDGHFECLGFVREVTSSGGSEYRCLFSSVPVWYHHR